MYTPSYALLMLFLGSLFSGIVHYNNIDCYNNIGSKYKMQLQNV